MYLRFILPMLLTISIVVVPGCKKDSNSNPTGPAGTLGRFRVQRTLVTTTNPDPNAPQAGFQAPPEDWNVSQETNGVTLSTTAGSVVGSGITNGYRFSGQVDVSPGLVWMLFQIDVLQSSSGGIYGTEEFQYWGRNGIGQTTFLGTESWRFEGARE